MNIHHIRKTIQRLWRHCRPQCIGFLIVVALIVTLIIVSCVKDSPEETDIPATLTPTHTIPPSPTATLPPSPTEAAPSPTESISVTPFGSCDSVTTDVNAIPIAMDGWEIDPLMLVNWNNRLVYSGNPAGLVKLTDILDTAEYIIEDPANCMGNESALLALDEMCRAARKAGCSKVKISTTGAYRTFATQDAFWQNHIKEDPNYGADPYSDPPRTVPGNASEHRIGLGFDIWLIEYDYAWLHKNCHLYGFILRYPADKVRFTGIMYEQWHFRYVGVEAATEMKQLGFCLEEYIAYKNGADITPYPTKPVKPRPTATPTLPPTLPTPTPTPEMLTPTPEVLTPTPEALTPTPDVFTPTPDVFTPTPEVPTPTPEVLTPTPELPPASDPTPTPTPEPTEAPVTPSTPEDTPQ